MSDPLIGTIQMFAGNFAPRNYALCNGQLMSIAQNTALFSIIGTFYGGNGTTTFALPNFQGRVPVHFGNLAGGGTYSIGQSSGTENVTLSLSQMPQHIHSASSPSQASANVADQTSPVGNIPAVATIASGRGSTQQALYTAPANATGVLGGNGPTIGIAGGSLPHSNLQPYLTVNFIICIYGIFPSRN